MNINTNHPFGGKFFAGCIMEKCFNELPGLRFEIISDSIRHVEDLENLSAINTQLLVEMRDELNELIMFMTSLEPRKEKVDEKDETPGAEKVIEGCQRCGKTHKITFRPLSNPIDSFNMWGLCVNTGQPVLLGTAEIASDEVKKQARPQCTYNSNHKAEGYFIGKRGKGEFFTCKDCFDKFCTWSSDGFHPFEEKKNSLCFVCQNNYPSGKLKHPFSLPVLACEDCAQNMIKNANGFSFEPFIDNGEKHE